MKQHSLVILTGCIVGALAVGLVALGNPGNMGFCIACFLRDMAGGLGLHRAAVVQYIRPEIIGLVMGAFIAALFSKEFKSRGGSSPLTRFVLGFFVMIGALMFLGCPLRMLLRIGGGDLNAIVGLAGYVVGILAGIYALNHGFSLRRTYSLGKSEGILFPLFMAGLLLLLLAIPSLLIFSTEGPGSMHAALPLSLAAGLLTGVLAQRSRLCTMGGFRDAFMFRDFHLLYGLIAMVAVVIAGNLLAGKFSLGFTGQPIAHADGLWNFLGMALVGWASVLLGGCPMRQLILAGEGAADSAIAVFGMMAGAAFSHNLGLASSAKGPTSPGKIAVLLGIAVVALITYTNMEKRSAAK